MVENVVAFPKIDSVGLLSGTEGHFYGFAGSCFDLGVGM